MFTVYSMPGCPDCLNAKNLLERESKAFEVKMLDQDFTTEQLRDLLGPIRTLPQIVRLNDRGQKVYIGGYRDLVKLLSGQGHTVRVLE